MSDVWGTVFQLERDKATGNDPDSLRRENARLRDALKRCADALERYAIADGLSPEFAAEAVAEFRVSWIKRKLARGRLAKRPVAFRVKDAVGDWHYFEFEPKAALIAEQQNTDYQGLYVRDGT